MAAGADVVWANRLFPSGTSALPGHQVLPRTWSCPLSEAVARHQWEDAQWPVVPVRPMPPCSQVLCPAARDTVPGGG